MRIEELLKKGNLDKDIDKKIDLLKNGLSLDVMALLNDWDSSLHAIVVDEERYPNRKVQEKPGEEYISPFTGEPVKTEPKMKDEPINRLSLPIEQDIVNIHTAFTVGTEPSMDFTANDTGEQNLYDALTTLLLKTKSKYKNKKVVRSWLSEKQVAEYWFTEDNPKFWNGIYKRNGIKGEKPRVSLNSTIWSPFRGDGLYPLYDEKGKMVAFSREYKSTVNEEEITHFMTLDDTYIYEWEHKEEWEYKGKKKHGFNKIPVIYAERDKTLCERIRNLRERLEALISSYADCIDYHFFPYLWLDSDNIDFQGGSKSRIIKLQNGSNIGYLTWDQVPTTIKLEMENLISQIYGLTNTPRISFDNLKSFGQALSGTAFKFMFMGIHAAVENHAEEIGEFFQRRVNFLIDSLGKICSAFNEPSQSIMIDVNIVPYMIDSLKDKVETAVKAVEGKVWSIKEGIAFAGNIDEIVEEYEQICLENEIDIKQPAKTE